MRPDIDHADEYVRNTTARAFSVVASALGIPSLLPFLKAVCRSKKSWQARHTGIRIVQQIPIMMGCAVLPHLRNLVNCIAHDLSDEQQKVRMMTTLGLAALAASGSIRYRVIQRGTEASLARYSSSPWQGPCRLLEGDRFHHPAHGS